MGSIGECFCLKEYSEEFINKIIDYRMHKYTELNRFLSCEEIAKKEMCAVDDVKKILESTTVIWNH